MRRLIHYLLAHIPRPVMQRMAELMVPILGLLYVGRGRECPICGTRRRRFLPYGYVTLRESALCPNCLSLERHRILWLYLVRETTILDAGKRVLHIAPEVCIMRKLRKATKRGGGEYLTADLESPLANLHFDVEQIPLEDNFADIILCNHLLEHVADDRKAMRELHRIMRPDGWGILLSPVEQDREQTFEDDSITDEAERTRIFGQYDHRRIYGRDYVDRLRESGFTVEAINYIEQFSEAERHLYSISNEVIYRVSK
ncbi:MAG: methyltransferase domain-containing protein [Rikenellaceae bacterium]